MNRRFAQETLFTKIRKQIGGILSVIGVIFLYLAARCIRPAHDAQELIDEVANTIAETLRKQESAITTDATKNHKE